MCSSGFDGHENEIINANYCRLTEFDYEWITNQILYLASLYCNNKVVSLLEGGYNIHKGIISSFPQSVEYHLNALVNNNFQSYDFDNIINFKLCEKNNINSNLINSNSIIDKIELSKSDTFMLLKKKRIKSYEKDLEIFNKSKIIKQNVFNYKFLDLDEKYNKEQEYKQRLRCKQNKIKLDISENQIKLKDEYENKCKLEENIECKNYLISENKNALD